MILENKIQVIRKIYFIKSNPILVLRLTINKVNNDKICIYSSSCLKIKLKF